MLNAKCKLCKKENTFFLFQRVDDLCVDCSKIKKVSTYEEQYEWMIEHFIDSGIIKYDDRINKWASCISFRYHEHVFGYYDTREDAINKAIDKLEEVYGENKSELYKNWLHYNNLRKNR
jgi:hypothetical protein